MPLIQTGFQVHLITRIKLIKKVPLNIWKSQIPDQPQSPQTFTPPLSAQPFISERLISLASIQQLKPSQPQPSQPQPSQLQPSQSQPSQSQPPQVQQTSPTSVQNAQFLPSSKKLSKTIHVKFRPSIYLKNTNDLLPGAFHIFNQKNGHVEIKVYYLNTQKVPKHMRVILGNYIISEGYLRLSKKRTTNGMLICKSNKFLVLFIFH